MYNSEKYIGNTLSSILLQEPHEFQLELIVVDDCSMDNSVLVVKSFNDPRIKLIQSKTNGGTANARNIGLRNAKGIWIQFIDSDDVIGHDLYCKFRKTLRPEYNCYLYSFICEYNDYSLIQTICEIKDIRAFGYFGSVCNKFIKRELCVEFKEDQGFEDVCFIIDMMNSKDLKIGLIPDAYYTYHRNIEQSKMGRFKEQEYRRMHRYAMDQIPKSNKYAKMYMLEIFVALIFDKYMPRKMSYELALITLLKLFWHLPNVMFNQFRFLIENRWINK
jgi:glycosyltransferase involved in cell wall biosynthesis